MMILHIETAVFPSSIALFSRERCIFEKTLTTDSSTIAQLLPAIDEAFQTLTISSKEIDAISISAGPGSYTGLRIGASTAKALCYAWEVPLLAISTLELTASALQQVISDNYDLLIPMVDFKRMEVVYAVFDQQLQVVIPETNAILFSNMFDEFKKKKLVFGGNGCAKAIEVLGHLAATFVTENVHLAKYAFSAVWKHFDSKNFANLAYFEPNYGKAYLAKKSQIKGLY